jgi:AcrR family transcriptional regulator
MATPAPAPQARRPGGRSARIRAAVHRAVEELVAESGPDAVTVPAVAERAGVHATTIYRRWNSAPELLAAVAVSRLTGDVVVPDTGSLRGDLRQWARDVAADLGDPDALALLRTVAGAATERGAANACLQDRRQQLEAMLERDRERGEEPPALDPLLEGLLGPIYFRALLDAAPMAPARAEAVVDELLARTA